MTKNDGSRSLLNSLPIFKNRDWGSPEKNSAAAELARRIENMANQGNQAEMQKLVAEVEHFMSPAFVLFKRTATLTERHRSRTWRTTTDNVAWKVLMDRTSTILQHKDTKELTEITPNIVAFLRRRNEHVLAQGLEDALKTCTRR